MSDTDVELDPRETLPSLSQALQREGIGELVRARAFKRILALKLVTEMNDQQLSKTDMAKRMGTSRAQLDRLLNPDVYNVTLETVARAAATLGKRLELDLV
jgi:DNA-binding Xre family transcriptional regulator